MDLFGSRTKGRSLERFKDLEPFEPRKLAQIVAPGNGVFKLVSMFEEAAVAAASAPREKMNVYFKDQVVVTHFFAETPTTIRGAGRDGDCSGSGTR